MTEYRRGCLSTHVPKEHKHEDEEPYKARMKFCQDRLQQKDKDTDVAGPSSGRAARPEDEED